MAQKLLAITLGTSSAKLSEIAKAGKKVQVFSCYDIQISEGLCDDGVILDVEGLSQELLSYISRFKIKTKKVVFSIATKRIASKEVVIPFVKEKQIKSIVKINAPEYFPVSNIEDYSINYSIIEVVKNAENTQYRLNVTATPNDVLKGYVDLASAMKCDIDIIDYAGNAILQVLKSQTEPGEVSAILQLGYENTVINIMNGSNQIMQRSVSNGLNAIISTVCDSVGLDEEDAVAFLEDNDISRITGAYPDVKYVFDAMITSIGRIFEYYNSRSGDHHIAVVKFIGDATYVNGIGSALESGLGYTTEEIFTLRNVEVKSKTLTPEFATNFMANIGSIIAPMDLSYEENGETEKNKEKDNKLPIWSVVVSVIASAILVGTSFVFNSFTQSEAIALENKVEALRPMRQLETELNKTAALAQSIAGFYDSTKGPNDEIVNLIDDLEKIMPETMSIDAMTIDNGVVSISGGGVGKKKIAKFIQDLKAIDYIEDVTVDYVSESSDGFEKYDEFTMRFRLVYIDEEAEAAEENATENEAEATAETPEGGM